MKFNRLLSCVLSLILTFTMVSASVYASGFADVDNDPTVSWAKSAIDEMTEAGYIKGYEDGSFKPFRAISKIECLLLMSRILGVEESDYSDIAKEAEDMYSQVVAKYNTTYSDELCYLMYLGILSENDLVNYASSANANTELLRQQAAVLMSKMLGEDTQAKNFSVDKPTYADNAKISSALRAYVEFVTDEGIMNGMDSDAEGNPQFSPTTSLTRAQMAMLLSRMIKKVDKSTSLGTIDSLDIDNDVITIDFDGDVDECQINADTVARKDGEDIDLSELAEGNEISIVEVFGHIQLIEVLGEGKTSTKDPEDTEDKEVPENTVIYAKIVSKSENSSGKKITLADTENSSNTATYPVSSSCKFYLDGEKVNFSNLSKNDMVKVVFSESEIISISVEDLNFTVKGTLDRVEFDDDSVYLYVDGDDGIQNYVVSSKGATVKRGGTVAEYRDLASGDNVTLTLKLGKVTAISATGSSEQVKGVLKQIIIASQPAVTILVDGKEKTYNVRSDAKIYIANAEATIYDLRPNITVNAILDSSEIQSLSASSVAVSGNGELSGTVSGINTSYKVITIKDEDGNTQSVYYSTATKFMKASGEATTAKSVEKGATLSITGAEKNGVFEANIIIIK